MRGISPINKPIPDISPSTFKPKQIKRNSLLKSDKTYDLLAVGYMAQESPKPYIKQIIEKVREEELEDNVDEFKVQDINENY